jgi:hypothetical protein
MTRYTEETRRAAAALVAEEMNRDFTPASDGEARINAAMTKLAQQTVANMLDRAEILPN